MKNIFEDLIKRIVTKEELIILLEEINLLERLIFKNKGAPLSERARGKIREETRDYLKKLEKDRFFSNSPNEQFSFFEKIKKWLQEVPQVKLEIAFKPSEDFLLRIKGWFREENQQEVILDMVVNHQIVGGAVIEYQGRYRNFTLAKKIEELIMPKETANASI